ncbi:hypothetical protein [Paenisporosarcina sp. OV554]|uniref:hypothetical protein n=1 Tax=Paenisporosarcina sp. OV554 TaxID=2135694 RepID=UPI000D394FAE|nr:hypothetical protein [Paenisporosarcina sp. OV554]PUB10587.1 hypothetical protein C8K15_11717 [Paenisporosarcina sp. OV554]
MDNKVNLLKVLDDKYGVSITPVEDTEKYDSYLKISNDDFAKINACFQNVPFALKKFYDANYYSGTYKVVYDKGLGGLQRSAKDPTIFRANVVAPGTNNDITGQALLQELNPEIMTLSNLAIASFTVASIATNQYFLARIDNKLESVEKKVNEIQRFLEIDKESQLWADGEFLKEVRDNAQYILNNETYSQATLINVQSIRRTALANIKLYYEQLQNLKTTLNQNDNSKETTEKLNKYKGYLPKYWYSVYLYVMAYHLEVYLSNITDSSFLQKVILEMEKIVNMYQEGYDVIKGLINKYIDEVKALKTNDIPAKVMKNVGEIVNSPGSSPFFKGVGIFLDMSADGLDKHEKTKKNAKKTDIIDELELVIKPYSDLEPLKFQIEAINKIDTAYNKRLELIVTSNEAYIK